jgi:3-dehydroquinate dehydratase
VQENIYQNNKNQVGDLSLKELGKKFQEQEARQKILTTQFQKISDVELIDELRKRVSQQNIKLSIYPHQEHIFITAKDITKEVSFPLPIEIKKT